MRVELLYGVVTDNNTTHRVVEIRSLTVRQGMAVKAAADDLVDNTDLDHDQASGLVRTAWRSWVDGLDRHLEPAELLDMREVDFGVLMDACREVSEQEVRFRAAATSDASGAGAGWEDDGVD